PAAATARPRPGIGDPCRRAAALRAPATTGAMPGPRKQRGFAAHVPSRRLPAGRRVPALPASGVAAIPPDAWVVLKLFPNAIKCRVASTHILGPFRLDGGAEMLFRGAEPVALGRRAVAVLRALVDRQGRPVSKEVLIDAGWPGMAVEESNLAVQIAALRRVFG